MPLPHLTLPKPDLISRKIRGGFSTAFSSNTSTSTSPPTLKHRESSLFKREPTPEPAYIEDEEDLLSRAPEEEPTDLRVLNNSLLALVAVFPNVEPEVFREMLSTFDEESRLQVVTEAMLKHQVKWVKGRWKAQGKKHATSVTLSDGKTEDVVEGQQEDGLPGEERFRSSSYRTAVRTAFYQELKGMSHSAVDAVLAEHNYSYTRSRPTLLTLASKSWRSSISAFFLRRRVSPGNVAAEKHPLVLWRSTSVGEGGDDALVPALKITDSWELNQELFDSLIRPLQREINQQRLARDQELAKQLNETEAEEAEALHECGCCYGDTTFERLSACDRGGHFVCFQCVRHTVNEALYGQGWGTSMDDQRGTLKCIVPMSVKDDPCDGCIPLALVRRALLDEKGGLDTFRKLDERLVLESLQKTGLPLVRCPFCPYAEIDDVYLPPTSQPWRLRRTRAGLVSPASLLLLVLLTGLLPFLLFTLILLTLFALLLHPTTTPLLAPSMTLITNLSLHLSQSLTRLARLARTQRFTCRSPLCALASCITCAKPFPPNTLHACYETERVALRQHVERAMSSAVKRTCPRCHLSFVKAEGCNKLTCVCGYEMCYVCRAEIGKEGYRHFCEHFRPKGGGGCEVCDKCDLYRKEDEEEMVRRAGERAEREWRAEQGGEGKGKEIDGLSWNPDERDGRFWVGRRKEWRWAAFVDWVVGSVMETPT